MTMTEVEKRPKSTALDDTTQTVLLNEIADAVAERSRRRAAAIYASRRRRGVQQPLRISTVQMLLARIRRPEPRTAPIPEPVRDPLIDAYAALPSVLERLYGELARDLIAEALHIDPAATGPELTWETLAASPADTLTEAALLEAIRAKAAAPFLPQGIQRKRDKGWTKPDKAVDVTRGGKWGNPYKAGEVGPHGKLVPDAETAVELFRIYAHLMPGYVALARAELAGRDLMCWCPLDAACHRDVLLAIANTPGDTP